MSGWGSYLFGKKAEAAKPPEEAAEKFAIKPFDPSDTYGGKAAEDALITPIVEAKAAESAFAKGSRRTQSDSTPIPQPTVPVLPRRTQSNAAKVMTEPPVMPKRAQSNASKVARMFGYAAPAAEPDVEEKILFETVVTEPPLAKINAMITAPSENMASNPAILAAFRDAAKAVAQPKLLNVVDEAVEYEQEEERRMLEFERQSERMRQERDAMDEEREKMFQIQEKMRIESERMAQEEKEMLEYYKIMGIEEPRIMRRKVAEAVTFETPVVQTSSSVKVAPSSLSDLRPREQENSALGPELKSFAIDKTQFEIEVEKRQAEAKKLDDERQKKLEIRREKQKELDRVIAEQEAYRLEQERRDLEESESEYEDEFIDDFPDGVSGDKTTELVKIKNEYDLEVYDIEDLIPDSIEEKSPISIPVKTDVKPVEGKAVEIVLDLRDVEEMERTRAKKEYELEVARYEEAAAAERLRFEQEQFERDAEKMEADRIANAQRRVIEGERRRREEVERETAEREERNRRDAEKKLKTEAREREEKLIQELEEEKERIEEAKRLERKRIEDERMERQRLEAEKRERQEMEDRELEATFRRQEAERVAREQEIMIERENEAQEALERERQRLEGERLAEEARFEEERRFSQQRRRENEQAEMQRQNAELGRQRSQAREDEEAAEAAFQRAEDIRKAEGKMRMAFAAMAAEKGLPPVEVPSLMAGPAGLPPAGRGSMGTNGPVKPPKQEAPARQNTLGPRPSIKGGLPSGPRGGGIGLPARARQKPSIDQGLGGPRAPPQTFSPQAAGMEIVGPPPRRNPSLAQGLPGGPKGITRNTSVSQGLPGGPKAGRNASINQGLPDGLRGLGRSPSIDQGLPSGPRSIQRNPSINQVSPAELRGMEPPRSSPSQETGPTRQNTLSSRPSVRGGLPSGPRGGVGPARRKPSINQLAGQTGDPRSGNPMFV